MIAEPVTRLIRADSDAIAEAARCLARGGLVAFPTETVYVGERLRDPALVKAQRPATRPR